MAAEGNSCPNNDFNTSMFNMKSMRILVILISTMLIVLGLVMVVLGNYAYWHYYSYIFFFDNAELRRFITPSALCVFVGSVLVVVSLFGFYGSIRKSTCMVNSYACMLFVLLILKLVAICLTYAFEKGAIWQNFEIPVWNISDPEIQTEVDFLQNSLGCCGSTYYTDYADVEFPSNMSTISVFIPESPSIQELPASCCVSSYGEFCTHVWPNGCKRVLLNTLEHNAVTIGTVAVSVMVINLLGIIFAFLLAHSIRRMKSEQALVTWKFKEQIIFARQIEDAYKNNQTNEAHNNYQANMV